MTDQPTNQPTHQPTNQPTLRNHLEARLIPIQVQIREGEIPYHKNSAILAANWSSDHKRGAIDMTPTQATLTMK